MSSKDRQVRVECVGGRSILIRKVVQVTKGGDATHVRCLNGTIYTVPHANCLYLVEEDA